jgi:hypothetical protein
MKRQATSSRKRRMKNDVVVATGCCDLCKAIIPIIRRTANCPSGSNEAARVHDAAMAAPLISAIPPMAIPRRHSSLHFRAVTCSRSWQLRVSRDSCSIRRTMRRLAIWRRTPTVRWRSRESSYARRSGGRGIEYPVRKSSIKCTTALTRIASLPTQSKPTSQW